MSNGTFLAGRLEQLGYTSYDAYLHGAHWKATRERYYASSRPQECMCGETEGLHLHHMTYLRLGCERLDDLLALCARCHNMIHVLARRGLLRYDLGDFASDDRAADYAEATIALRERAVAQAPDVQAKSTVEADRALAFRLRTAVKKARGAGATIDTELALIQAVTERLNGKAGI